MRPSRRAVVAAVCTLITALGLGACGETLANGPSASDQGFVSGDGTLTVVPVAERGEAPSLEGARLGGGRLDLAEFRGDVVVLNVWGRGAALVARRPPNSNRLPRN